MRRELNKDEAVGYEGKIAESARLIGGPMVLREGVVVAVSLVALFQRLTSHSTFVPASADKRAAALVRSAIERMGKRNFPPSHRIQRWKG